MAFFNALLAIADPGDEIILLTPYYFNHEMAVAMLNCRAVLVPLDANYQIDVDAVRRAVTPRTRAIVTISPNNPSGAVYSRACADRNQPVVPRSAACITSATRPTSISCTTAPNTFRPAR